MNRFVNLTVNLSSVTKQYKIIWTIKYSLYSSSLYCIDYAKQSINPIQNLIKNYLSSGRHDISNNFEISSVESVWALAIK